MDARDSSPGGDSPVEDDQALSVTAALAKEAAGLFQSRRYSECVDLLKQLSRLKEDDPKVAHNIAVAEYYRDGCFDPRKLLDVLTKKRSKDVLCASGEEMESANNHRGNAVSGSSDGTTGLYQFSAAKSGCFNYSDDSDVSIVTFNIAVILYHLHEYNRALPMLESLFQHIEALDEVIALHICLLLLDTAFALKDAARASDVIQYLEKFLGVSYKMNQVDNGTIAQNPSSIQAASANTNVAVQDPISDISISTNMPDDPLSRTLSDEYETLISTMDSGALKFGRSTLNHVSKPPVGRAAPCVDLKLNMQLYKVRFLLLTRNLKVAKREVKLAMNIVRDRDSSSALMLKSQLEYARGNHRKAIKLLMTSINRADPVMLSMFNSNLGCIYHQLGEHHLSVMYLSKALKSCSTILKEKPLKLSTFSHDKSLLIFYNYGLQYLACGKPLAAARCLYRSTPIFHNRPLLWLRLAECCLLAQEKGLLRQAVTSSSEEIKLSVVGSGKWRHVVVVDMNSRNRHLDIRGEDGRFGPDDQCRLSLPFARQCLLNALHLLDKLEEQTSRPATTFSLNEVDKPNQGPSGSISNSSHKNWSDGDSKSFSVTSASLSTGTNNEFKETKGSMNSNNIFQGSVSSFEDMCRKENHMMKQAVLGDLAYVELCLENPLKALSHAQTLQQMPDCSKMYSFLACVYAAEALCLLNRPKEAADQLSVYLLDGTSVALPYSDEDRERWTVEVGGDSDEPNNTVHAKRTAGVFLKPEDARGSLYLNLAAICAIEGNLEQADRFVAQAQCNMPNNSKAILAAVYLDLLHDRTQDALSKLKKSSRVRFQSSAWTLNSS
ncbi:CCR4-NOT transcription complex subunit 10 protein [Dioscorea alata]|uniref:CCR4-NOT transcription complex subunit 10 protein n=1 Tax=Dioscorea alata TaxID=55571 RepID=A0ACB7VDS7_DIOAL|nr:CCR4-NOT transcription complex subunit 10 protein [Dioscorea alata]